MELGVNSDETLPKEPIKKDSQDPKQNLQTLLQRQAKFLESCREVKVGNKLPFIFKYKCCKNYIVFA